MNSKGLITDVLVARVVVGFILAASSLSAARTFAAPAPVTATVRHTENIPAATKKKPSAEVRFTLSQESFAGAPQPGLATQRSDYSTLAPDAQGTVYIGNPDRTHQVFSGRALGNLPLYQDGDVVFAAPELYFEDSRVLTAGSRGVFTVGRKLEDWSELDSHWNLGLWQPLVRWDASQPIEQGLFGAFYSYEITSRFRILGMASGLYLPDQGSEVHEENGELVSSNRWYHAPSRYVDRSSKTGSLTYDLHRPDTWEAVQQESVAGMIVLGDTKDGLMMRLSAADMPVNQLHLAVDTDGISDLDGAHAPIYPMVIRHHLYTAEMGYSWEYTRILVSSTMEDYERPRVSNDWLQTPENDSRYDGAVFTQDLTPIGMKRSQMSVAWVKRTQINSQKESTYLATQLEASLQRFQFEEMAELEFAVNAYAKAQRRLDVTTKYVYSIDDSGEWLQAGLRYRHSQEWVFALSGDVFGVPAETDPSTSFISKFRGNDRVMGSMTYVF